MKLMLMHSIDKNCLLEIFFVKNSVLLFLRPFLKRMNSTLNTTGARLPLTFWAPYYSY